MAGIRLLFLCAVTLLLAPAPSVLAQAVDVKINFQPASASVPPGYVADTGQGYTDARGFGWVAPGATGEAGAVDKAADTRERSVNADQLLDTLVIMQNDKATGVTNGSWEYALPNGTYRVEVSVGDPSFADSKHRVNIEGQNAINDFAPTSANSFASNTVTTDVNDGKLTIDATGGSNTKLNYVEISGAPATPDTTDPVAEVKLSGATQSPGVYANRVMVTVNASDEGGSGLASTAYSVNGAEFRPYTGPFEVSEPGNYTVRARATDGAGNTTTTEPTSFEVVVPPPSRAEIDLHNLDATRVRGAPAPGLYDDWLVFGRIGSGVTNHEFHDVVTLKIKNSDATDDLIIDRLRLSDTTEFAFPDGEDTRLPLTIDPNESYDLDVEFVEASGGRGVRSQTLTIGSNDADEPEKVVQLRGAYMERPEGGNEVTLTQISRSFGYSTEIGEPAGGTLNEKPGSPLAGDEVRSKFWQHADPNEPVYVRELAAFHGCCEEENSILLVNETGNNGFQYFHDGLYGQSMLPLARSSTTPTSPTEMKVNPTFKFEIKVAGVYTTNTDGNLGVRTWPVRDRSGAVVPDAYLVAHDNVGSGCGTGSSNCDYNDNVYLITNVQPEAAMPAGLTAAPGDGEVELTWDANAEGIIAGYNVYRSRSEPVATNGTPLNGPTPLAAPGYTDRNVANGDTYHYVVQAVAEGGARSPSSTAVQATPADTRIDFQPANATVAPGYEADTGQGYTDARGFGWVAPGTSTPVDMTKNTRERSAPEDGRLRTLIIMQGNGGSNQPHRGSWEMAVPDGVYDVSVGVGDSDFFDGTDGITVEGKDVIPAFQRNSSEAHRTGSGTVTVDDGRLTVSASGTNTKITHLTIEANEAPEIAPPADQGGFEGERASLQIKATDPDGDALTYGATGLPPGLSIDATTGRISGTLQPGSSAASPYTVRVTATDDGNPSLEGSASYAWTVEEPPDTAAPQIETVQPRPGSKLRNRKPNIVAVVTDGPANPGENDIQLYLDNRPRDFSYDQDDGRLSYASKKLSLGKHNVRVVARDAAGNDTQKTWSFRVVR